MYLNSLLFYIKINFSNINKVRRICSLNRYTFLHAIQVPLPLSYIYIYSELEAVPASSAATASSVSAAIAHRQADTNYSNSC